MGLEYMIPKTGDILLLLAVVIAAAMFLAYSANMRK